MLFRAIGSNTTATGVNKSIVNWVLFSNHNSIFLTPLANKMDRASWIIAK